MKKKWFSKKDYDNSTVVLKDKILETFDFVFKNKEKEKTNFNIEQKWKEVAGLTISQKTSIISFENGILKIKTANSVWKSQLYLFKGDLVLKLQKISGEIAIKDIIFY